MYIYSSMKSSIWHMFLDLSMLGVALTNAHSDSVHTSLGCSLLTLSQSSCIHYSYLFIVCICVCICECVHQQKHL